MPQRIATNLGLSLLATVAALLAVEAGLRIFEPRSGADCSAIAERAKCRAALADGLAFDTRPRRQVLRELASEGREAWPAVKPNGVLAWDWQIRLAGRGVTPLAGLSHALTVYCNESGEWISYQSDEYGFRNPQGSHAGRAELAILGDSYAQGYCLPSEAEPGALLRRSHPRTVNLGVDGNGPLNTLATLREFAAPLEPRRVLWLYFSGNDLEDLAWERGFASRMAYLEPEHSEGLRAGQSEVDRQLRSILRRQLAADAPRSETYAAPDENRPGPVVSFVSLTQLRKRWLQWRRARRSDPSARTPERAPEPPAFNEALLRRILQVARDEVAGWNGQLLFVYLPSWHGLRDPVSGAPYRQTIRHLVEDLGIGWVDVHQAFSHRSDPATLFPFGLPGHYTEEGQLLMVKTLEGALAAASHDEPHPARPRGKAGEDGARTRDPHR